MIRSSTGSPRARRSPSISVATGSGTTSTTPRRTRGMAGNGTGAAHPRARSRSGGPQSRRGHRPLPGATRHEARSGRSRSRCLRRGRPQTRRRRARRPARGADPAPRRAAGGLRRRRPSPPAGGAPGHGHRRQGRHHQGRLPRPSNPLGVRVASFKEPTAVELAHDYLWRVHPQVPGDGEIIIFNRSHYEDVLVVRVHDLVPAEGGAGATARSPTSSGCSPTRARRSVKFFLHIDKDEQAERLQARLDDPAKHWKFAHRRPRRARALGRLPGGVTRTPRADQHRGARPGTWCPPTASGTATWSSPRCSSRPSKALDLAYPDPSPDLASVRIE